MCKTKFLQMCSFSITFTSLHSLNLPFLNGNLPFHIYYFIIYYFISVATPKFPLDSLHRHPDFPYFLHFHPDFRPRFYENSYFS